MAAYVLRTQPDDANSTILSIANPQQVLPLPKVALEAHALGNLIRRDDAALDLLAALGALS